MHSMFGGNAYKVAMIIIQLFSLTFFRFFAFATQLFSTPVTSSNLRNQAPPFTRHCSNQLFSIAVNFTMNLQHWYFKRTSHPVKCFDVIVRRDISIQLGEVE